MFSEYASKFLGKSQRTAPLFQGDVNAFLNDGGPILGWVTESMNSSIVSQEVVEDDPPLDLMLQEQGFHSSTSLEASDAPPSFLEQPSHLPSQLTQTTHVAQLNHTQTTPSHAGRQGPGGITSSSDRSTVMNGWTWDNRQAIEDAVALLYAISVAFVLAAAVIAFSLNDSSRSGLYMMFVKSIKAIWIEILLSLMVAVAWLSTLVSNTKLSVRTTTYATPVALLAAGSYGILGSLHKSTHHGPTHWGIRVISIVIILLACIWIQTLRSRSHHLNQATEMVNLSVRVVLEFPQLILISGAQLIIVAVTIPIWLGLSSRALMEGKVGIGLAIAISLILLWSGRNLLSLQKTLTAGICAIWYENFCSLSPSPCWTSTEPTINMFTVVMKGFDKESRGMILKSVRRFVLPRLGSCCLSGLLLLMWRVPLYFIPSWLFKPAVSLSMATLPERYLKLSDTLLISYATIINRPLLDAADTIDSVYNSGRSRESYRLAKMLLLSTRITCTAAACVVSWVWLDRSSDVLNIYTCVFVVSTFVITWSVLASIDSIFSMILDALFILSSLAGTRLHPEMNRVFSRHD